MLKPTQGARQEARAGRASEAARRGTVLIVEPDALTRWALEVYLESWFDVLGCAAGADGQRLLERQPVQALVVADSADVPVERLARAARAREPRVRVVCTGAEARCSALGGATFLEKPFELAQLACLLGVEPRVVLGGPASANRSRRR